jgi:hypothetical protein
MRGLQTFKGQKLSEQDTLAADDAADDVETPVTDPTQTGAETSDKSDTAADSGKNATTEPKVQFTPEQQAIFDKVIGEKTFKAREAERKFQAAEERLREMEARLPKENRPAVPKLPDPYDADYETKIAERDRAIQAAAAFDAKQQSAKEQREALERQRFEAKQTELYKTAVTYKERSDKLGIPAPDLQNAATALSNYGISEDLTQFLLKDDQGPLMTMYLAKNPGVLERVTNLSPIEVGAYIASEIKPKLAAVKSRTQAPDPADVLDGGGSPRKDRGPKGATFE